MLALVLSEKAKRILLHILAYSQAGNFIWNMKGILREIM